MIRPELLEILRCPETHQKLSLALAELVARLNSQISARQIRNRAGKLLEQRVEGGLLREDGTVLYPIRGKLPILLIDEGVLLALEPLKPGCTAYVALPHSHADAKVQASMQLKAGDRAKLPLCRVWNGSNKISL